MPQNGWKRKSNGVNLDIYHFDGHENENGKPKIIQREDTLESRFYAPFIAGIRGNCDGDKEGASSKI